MDMDHLGRIGGVIYMPHEDDSVEVHYPDGRRALVTKAERKVSEQRDGNVTRTVYELVIVEREI